MPGISLVFSDTDSQGAYTLTVQRYDSKSVRLEIFRRGEKTRVVLSDSDWEQLIRKGEVI